MLQNPCSNTSDRTAVGAQYQHWPALIWNQAAPRIMSLNHNNSIIVSCSDIVAFEKISVGQWRLRLHHQPCRESICHWCRADLWQADNDESKCLICRWRIVAFFWGKKHLLCFHCKCSTTSTPPGFESLPWPACHTAQSNSESQWQWDVEKNHRFNSTIIIKHCDFLWLLATLVPSYAYAFTQHTHTTHNSMLLWNASCLQGIEEENWNRVHKELWPRGVVVPLNHDEVLQSEMASKRHARPSEHFALLQWKGPCRQHTRHEAPLHDEAVWSDHCTWQDASYYVWQCVIHMVLTKWQGWGARTLLWRVPEWRTATHASNWQLNPNRLQETLDSKP